MDYYWLQVRPYKWWMLLSAIAVGLGQLLVAIIQPLFYRDLIDIISSGQKFTEFSGDLRSAFIMLALVTLGYEIFFRIDSFVIANVRSRIEKNLEDNVTSRLLQKSRRFFADSFSGGLVAKSRRYLGSFATIQETIFYSFFMTTIRVVGTIWVLFANSELLGLVFLLWFVIYLGITASVLRYKRPLDEAYAESDTKTTAGFSDLITNVLNVKIFGNSKKEQDSYASLTREKEKAYRRAWNFSNVQYSVQSIALASLNLITLMVAINLWMKGVVTVGFVVLVQVYVGGLFHSMFGLAQTMTRFTEAVTRAKEMVQIFESDVEVKDPENPESVAMRQGDIRFDQVTFKYEGTNKPVLKKLSLDIPAGQSVGLVGESGFGKSTITNLLMRFMDVTDGSITIDGQDIRAVLQDDLRRHISYVPQEPILFHRSLAENIKYGKLRATKKEMIAAAKAAHATEFIEDLPQGYNTLVGERGIKLSGGQRQRIAIARVMLEDAPILILDEATSALDSISEKLIQSAFSVAMKNRTTIVIAHRLSTVKNLDRIIVLDKGKIVEDGTHDELIAKKGYYYKLWQHQADYTG